MGKNSSQSDIGIPRRTLDELLALHELESGVKDIFVEGDLDARLIRWYLLRRGHRHIQVYKIDAIDIDSNIDCDTINGNRHRIVALAQLLRDFDKPEKISCICDQDFETWFPTIEDPCPSLLFTDFANLEGYVWNSVVFEKFLSVVVGSREVTWVDLSRSLVPILVTCFFIRLAHAKLGWPLAWIEPTGCCQYKRGSVTFNSDEFLNRLLQKNKHFHQKDLIKAELLQLNSTNRLDPRLTMHGHDLSNVLRWYLHKHGMKCNVDEDGVVGSLFGCLEVEELRQCALFTELERRANFVRNSLPKMSIAP